MKIELLKDRLTIVIDRGTHEDFLTLSFDEVDQLQEFLDCYWTLPVPGEV